MSEALTSTSPASIIATIDFEASSLHGYPIEVGIALWDRAADEIRVWSTLIRPIPYWRRNPVRWWDARSEGVHGIAPEALDSGLRPRQVLSHLDALIGGREAFCDGGPYDQAFLTHLAHAARTRPSFHLRDVEALCIRVGLDDPGRLRFTDFMRENGAPVEHRAGSDALRLLRAVAAAAGHRPCVAAVSAEQPLGQPRWRSSSA